jgi:hypothetical protein
VEVYRLLILDGYKSYLNQDFKDYCFKQKILTLCIPPHSSYILQPLDVVCFSLLKRSCGNYGRTRHNVRTCKKNTEASSESDESTTYIGSLFDSDEN